MYSQFDLNPPLPSPFRSLLFYHNFYALFFRLPLLQSYQVFTSSFTYYDSSYDLSPVLSFCLSRSLTVLSSLIHPFTLTSSLIALPILIVFILFNLSNIYLPSNTHLLYAFASLITFFIPRILIDVLK